MDAYMIFYAIPDLRPEGVKLGSISCWSALTMSFYWTTV